MKGERMSEAKQEKKKPGRPAKPKPKHPAEIALEKALKENKELKKIALEDTADGNIQYRETEGIIKLMAQKAKAEKLSVNQWVRRIARKAIGLA